MFIDRSKDPLDICCEDCYRKSHYGNSNFVKSYKRCILSETITPQASRSICRCESVPHFDSKGYSLSLFPVQKTHSHLSKGGVGTLQCGLLKLGHITAEAMYEGMQTNLNTAKQKKPRPNSSVMEAFQGAEEQDENSGLSQHKKTSAGSNSSKLKFTHATKSSLHDSDKNTETSGSTPMVSEELADDDIPFIFKKYTEKYPFGNIHMALQIGPLLIENGVSQ
jgi:hypothetical protein